MTQPLPVMTTTTKAPLAIPSFTGDLPAAHQQALSTGQPLFVPSPVYTDDRGWSLMNQMTGILAPAGQINFSYQYPGIIKAWHRHAKQTDFWLCLLGHIKVGVHRESDNQSWLLVTGEKRPGTVIIPPSLWHGTATVGPSPAGLLYYVTHAYNPKAPDEERRPHDSIPDFPWDVQMR